MLFAIVPLVPRVNNTILSFLRSGFTVVEIISIVIICISVGGFLFNGYQKYQRQQKAAEIPILMNMIFDAELRYYQNSDPSSKGAPQVFGRATNHKKFLALSPQPLTVSPAAQMGNFSQGDWASLGISYDQPVYYSYSVETTGVGPDATFSIVAHGDLDGDQQLSRYEMTGRLNPNEQALGKSQIFALDPLE